MQDWTPLTEEQFKQIREFSEWGNRKHIIPFDYLCAIDNQDHPMHFRGERAGRFSLEDLSFYPTEAYSLGLRMLFAKNGRTPEQAMLNNTPTAFKTKGNLYICWSDYDEIAIQNILTRQPVALLELKEINPGKGYSSLELSDLTLCLAPRTMEIQGFANYQTQERISIYAQDSLQNRWTFHCNRTEP